MVQQMQQQMQQQIQQQMQQQIQQQMQQQSSRAKATEKNGLAWPWSARRSGTRSLEKKPDRAILDAQIARQEASPGPKRAP